MENSSLSDQQHEIELEKLEIDRKKLLLDQERLKREKLNFIAVVVSVFIPLLLVALTFAYNSWQDQRRAKFDFQLKAVEIILNAESPSAAYNKAKSLVDLFPGYLPEGFADTYDPSKYGGTSPDVKREMLYLIVENPDKKNEIIEMYKELFPDATWIDVLR